ncbi:MAG: aldo/keto reductase, partial [Anaerolineae bacterium]|nr:aldo/keto reductase [Anaerolineae bacterium]
LIKREVEDSILPYCGQHNIGVIAYSPMQSGLLTGKFSQARMDSLAADDWRRREDEFMEPRLSRNLKLADKLVEIGARHGHSAGETAVAWTLRRPEVTGAIVGFRNPAQVDGIIGALDFRLSAAEIAEIEAFQAALA